MALTALFSLFLVAGLGGDVSYTLSNADPSDVGSLGSFQPAPSMRNRFVRGQGVVTASEAIRYERVFEEGAFELVPVVGERRIWVEMRVADRDGALKLAPPTTFVGRLLPLQSALFRLRGLRIAMTDRLAGATTKDAWVLVDGATPASLRWTLALAALLTAFAAYNLVMIGRMVRPIR
jgi:hypothetical protein